MINNRILNIVSPIAPLRFPRRNRRP